MNDHRGDAASSPAMSELAHERDYQPPVWDSWSDPPEAFPEIVRGGHEADEPTQAWSLGPCVPGAGVLDQAAPAGDDRDDEPTQRPEETTDPLPELGGADDRLLAAGRPTGDDPSGRRPPPPEVEVGTLISDRYRLEEPIAARGGTYSWRAFDQKLSRPVMLHLLDADADRNLHALHAARSAAAATDSRFLRVLDAADAEMLRSGGQAADGQGADGGSIPGLGGYIVCEFVPGESLERLLAAGPLSGLEAAWVVRELADALAPLHAQGLVHHQLTPDTVVITATGNIKIVGFLTEEAMFPRPRPHGVADGEDEDDVRALGQMLYACLVTRWPAPHHEADQQHWGLAPAPMDGHGWLTPRQVRAGVSPALDQVCDQVLNRPPRGGAEPLETAAAINIALSRVLGTADASADLEHRVRHPRSAPLVTAPQARVESSAGVIPPPPRPGLVGADPDDELPPDDQAEDDDDLAELDHGSRPSERRPALIVLVALVALTMLGSLIAVAINQNGREQSAPPPSSAPAGPSSYRLHRATSFDPEADGGNGEELPEQAALAIDGKPATVWTTMRYRGSPKLGLLKPGVGLVVDLGEPVDVTKVVLTLQGRPTNLQILVPTQNPEGDQAPMNSVDQWRVVASANNAGTTATLSPQHVVRTRFVLVYLTSLPNVGGDSYRGAVAEIKVWGP